MTSVQIKKATLKLGARGEDVRELQRLLNHHNYAMPIDGIFGPWTEGCVKDYQFVKFLVDDGIVGPKTWKALYSGAPVDMPVLRRGATGEMVVLVQLILSRLSTSDIDFTAPPHYTGEVDGLFGPITEEAICSFQARSALPVDGIVGDRTWHALSKHGYLRY
jgi:peptidoglycan hydrolase-like protein with peptidoglycan-binding domain